MAADIDKRLTRLKSRRSGDNSINKSATYAMDARADSVPILEAYEKRSLDKSTRYALGAMQEVDPKYTANSIVQGERVKEQLRNGLMGKIPVSFEYQGSVPLNVHIKGVSDIDLLVLRDDFLKVDLAGVKNLRGGYSDWAGDPDYLLLSRLRTNCAQILVDAFPAANVDTKGKKSITIDGGSLTRKVDVVPSHWFDTREYQANSHPKDRGVCILDISDYSTIKNFPFLHAYQVNIRDYLTQGGVKKAIRLLKTLKSDSDYENSIALSSYDIASLVWNMNIQCLTVQAWNELSLLATLRNELITMVAHKESTMKLRTPDDIRCVLDSDEKYTGLVFLYSEINMLAEQVAKEVLGIQNVISENVEPALRNAVIN